MNNRFVWQTGDVRIVPPPEPKFPDVTVTLVGQDGNVFSVIGRVARGLRRGGHADAATDFTEAAFDAHSYDEVLALAVSYVEVR